MKPAAPNRVLRETSFTVGRQVLMIAVSLLLASLFLAAAKYDMAAIVNGIIDGLTSDISGTIRWATPMILAGLAICVTYKAEVFNLGVDGQIYMGAAAATVAALRIPDLPAPLAIVTVFIAAMLAGALFALIPALLKVYLNTNEVVSTLLLNFIALNFIEYLVIGPLRDTSTGVNLNASPVFGKNTWLPRLAYLQPSEANIGFYIALIAAVILAVVFYRMTIGHEIKIVGANPTLAHYAGISPNRITLQVMLISGAIGGLIGAIEVTAIQHRLLAAFNPGLGFNGVVVSLLANNNPIGVIFSGFFFGALKNGGINMERVTDVPSAVTEIVMAIVIITISARMTVPRLLKRRRKADAAALKAEGDRT